MSKSEFFRLKIQQGVRCINCEFAVLDEKKGGTGLCWKESADERRPLDVKAERKCELFIFGAMDQLRIRDGWLVKDCYNKS